MKKTSTILAIGSGLFLGQAQAEIETEFHVGYNSEYVFRGVDLGNDAYEYGLNIAGSCDCGLDWSAGLWQVSPDASAPGGGIDELDIFAGVSKTFGEVTVSAGFTMYTYDGSVVQDDAEAYLGVSSEFAGVSVGLTAYFGTDGILTDQILLEGSLGYSHEINDKATLNFGVVYGYILEDGKITNPAGTYAVGDGKAYLNATISADIALSEDITLSPYIQYVEAFDSNLAAAGPAIQDGFVSGAKLTFSF